MMNILFFIFCLVTSHISHYVDGIQDISKEDVKFEIKPNPITNSPIKTIRTKFGDIVDCVDIYKQPAFNHPLLKDHKLQLKPNFEIEKIAGNSLEIESMFGLDEENCPEGTVPIQRIVKDNFTEETLSLNHHILTKGIPGVHLAEVSLKKRFGPYYKVSGTTSVYNPQIHKNTQISMSHIWVENGPGNAINKISAGWHVDPKLYGDYGTHFYVTWTADNFEKTGCYNLRCPGFIQLNKDKYYLGGRFPYVSVYGGPIYEIPLTITLDPMTKSWWLTSGKISIGYFPAALFKNNFDSASIVGWGGRTRTDIGNTSPEMGSGYFPDKIMTHSCYFRSALIEDESRQIFAPKPDKTVSFSDVTKCYGVRYYGDQGRSLGSVLLFGGPGHVCGD